MCVCVYVSVCVIAGNTNSKSVSTSNRARQYWGTAWHAQFSLSLSSQLMSIPSGAKHSGSLTVKCVLPQCLLLLVSLTLPAAVHLDIFMNHTMVVVKVSESDSQLALVKCQGQKKRSSLLAGLSMPTWGKETHDYQGSLNSVSKNIFVCHGRAILFQSSLLKTAISFRGTLLHSGSASCCDM